MKSIERRIVLITPSERHQLSTLKYAGFTGYLVKPVRAASLAAQMSATHDMFERDGIHEDGEPVAPANAETVERCDRSLDQPGERAIAHGLAARRPDGKRVDRPVGDQGCKDHGPLMRKFGNPVNACN
jgi:hypothetical protein